MVALLIRIHFQMILVSSVLHHLSIIPSWLPCGIQNRISLNQLLVGLAIAFAPAKVKEKNY
jgi:hypothetical protein